VAHTGRDLMRRLKEAADIDAVILDSELPYPPLPDTIASLRYDVHAGLLPVRIVSLPVAPGTVTYVSDSNRPVTLDLPPQATESINVRTEARLNRLIESYKQIAVVRGPVIPALVQREFAPADGAAPPEPAAASPTSQPLT